MNLSEIVQKVKCLVDADIDEETQRKASMWLRATHIKFEIKAVLEWLNDQINFDDGEPKGRGGENG